MIRTQAFVIHSIKFKEADRIYTLYTRNHGKVTARGRGVRRSTAKIGPHLQPLFLNEIELVAGKQWYTITGSENQMTTLPDFNSRYIEMTTYICKILKKHSVDGLDNSAFFDDCKYIIECIYRDLLSVSTIQSLFLLRFLKHHGHNLQLERCVRTGKTDGPFAFSIADGGIIQETNDSSHHSISSDTIMRMRLLQDASIDQIENHNLDEKIATFSERSFQYWFH